MFRSAAPAHARRRAHAITPLAVLLAVLVAPALARAVPAAKAVRYGGLRLSVPASWPVYDLAREPRTCVRFNRHAVYLGAPGDEQLCPSGAAGRTEALLVEPLAAGRTGIGPDAGAAARLIDRRAGVSVTATWGRDPGLIRRILGVAALAPLERAADAAPAPASLTSSPRAVVDRAAQSSPASGPASPGELFQGLGFDACSAPSQSQMASWSAASPYAAVGIYIGGANSACEQPVLNAAWVSAESAAGWHLLPIYVGLQAPGNSCGCAAISSVGAVEEGEAAAADAVVQAQALGIERGNPIYFDMESYPPGGATTATVLAFLGAWTSGLHGAGYLSGVYSSEESGIADLVAEVGTGYAEPDEIWIANWNDSAVAGDPLVPASDWPTDRLHQFAGASNQTYGGVTLNVDQDYVDAPTAAAGSSTSAPIPPAAAVVAPPTATSSPTISGAPLVGQTLTEAHGVWTGAPTSYTYQWEDCVPPHWLCAPIAGATASTYTIQPDEVGQAIKVLEYAVNAGGAGAAAVSNGTTIIEAGPTSGYWLLSAFGNVVQSPGASWYGSAVRARSSSIVGIAPTPSRRGYWLAEATGRILSYGNARRVATGRYGRLIRGIVPSFRGAWLYTSAGNVFSIAGAPWYGSPLHVHTAPIVGMASTRNGRGYWLIDASGRIYSYGDAPQLPAVQAGAPIRGIVTSRAGGAWVFTTTGNVVPVGGAVSYGSPLGPPGTTPPAATGGSAAAAGATTPAVVSMTATADGRGYWILDAVGQVLPYGDAATFPVPPHLHPFIGIGS